METTYPSSGLSSQDTSQHSTSSYLVEQSADLHTRCSCQPSHQLFRDASQMGWGAHLEPKGLLYHGHKTNHNSINLLETMAISLALRQTHHHIIHSTVLISTDNTFVVSYLSLQSGTHSPDLCLEVWRTLNWCHQNKIRLVIRHILGKFNVLPGRFSKIAKPISTEWSLNQFQMQFFKFPNFPNLDLFATRLNHRLLIYLSPIPDEKALAIDV